VVLNTLIRGSEKKSNGGEKGSTNGGVKEKLLKIGKGLGGSLRPSVSGVALLGGGNWFGDVRGTKSRES